MKRFYSLRPHDVLRDASIALLIGAGIGIILWIGDEEGGLWPRIVFSAWIGLAIYLSVNLFLILFSPLLSRLDSWRLYLAQAPLMFLASALGFFLGIESLPLLDPLWRLIFGDTPNWLLVQVALPDWRPLLLFAGGMGVVVGLLFFRYELLKERLRRSIGKLKERELAERELETARKIQRRILGPKSFEGDGYRIAAENLPARYVAGDFYDVFQLGDGALGLVVADVSGKGMGASLVMASVKGRLPLLAAVHGVAETLTELNRSLCEELDRREFVALALIRYDPATGEIELANAGMPDPYVVTADREPRPLVAVGPRLPLGVRHAVAYRSTSTRLEPGERLLLLTDGLPETPAGDGAPLGYGELESMLRSGEPAPGDWLAALFERLEARTEGDREDDWTAMVLERTDRSAAG